ncbi:hypothetical protein WS1083 [Wolinella succinogenes]|uniref:Uncharacterized protein n=1 Tax=Wolinella succinogenes (strain ATCC 29543 / DSM 1740 / CCUG 13145 / JCM 31913 / LMG 7466 / NCTC 11488 / FDC 602W) TaxID=273121 RepID=Q7MRS6_WOLSU|nr:hypothetical protein WS1083 [Wolinella succinogenes]
MVTSATFGVAEATVSWFLVDRLSERTPASGEVCNEAICIVQNSQKEYLGRNKQKGFLYGLLAGRNREGELRSIGGISGTD